MSNDKHRCCIFERTKTVERVITEYFKDNDEIILVELSELILEKQCLIAVKEAIYITAIYNNILFVSRKQNTKKTVDQKMIPK
uniref:Uncharacterized protein n=1 Tax=Panagrolaimus sp. JU765 TaxID=591449 RepID=A0AC34PUB4_9BILA